MLHCHQARHISWDREFFLRRLDALPLSRIRLLPETIVNRIAAGEVIERPAAAAKELIENSLDAGATRIVVCLHGGGVDRLEVIDNGNGMTADELALSVLRHATSKLTDEMLVRITTLGFRGEALPSIGAAARLDIVSRTAQSSHANRITVEGGRVSDVMPTAGPPGTRVTMRDLFFATPARRKFLKSTRVEEDHVEAVVRRLAIAVPHVAFRLESEGRLLFDLQAQDLSERVAALVGPDAANVLLPVEEERGAYRIAGFICAPSVTRATPIAQMLIVNGRPVSDPVLRTAVRVAYRDVIAAGRHAIVALSLSVPTEEVDVNVHPAKTEVRFRDAGIVRSLVIGALRRALGVGNQTHLAMAPVRSGSVPTVYPGTGWSDPASSERDTRSEQRGAFSPMPPAAHGAGFAEAQLSVLHAPSARSITPNVRPTDFPLGAPVAQVLDTYIIAVASDGSLVLVDQHAAHERVMHEAIRGQMLEGGVRSQPLLLPAVVDIAPADAARLLERSADLALLGLEIEAFGPGAILVRAMPAALGAPEPAPLLRDLVDEFTEENEETTLSARLDAVVARMACHGSIRAGRRLTSDEMSALLRQIETTPRAATCSHGRPTALKLSKADIEALFGRR